MLDIDTHTIRSLIQKKIFLNEVKDTGSTAKKQSEKYQYMSKVLPNSLTIFHFPLLCPK